MQDIYNYTPETNHVYGVYSVAAVLYLQFVLLVMLFRPWNMFCKFTLAPSVLLLLLLILLQISLSLHVKNTPFWNATLSPVLKFFNSDMRSRHLDRLTLIVWITDLAELSAMNLLVE